MQGFFPIAENLLQWVFFMGIFHYLARNQRVRTNSEPKLEVQLQQKYKQKEIGFIATTVRSPTHGGNPLHSCQWMGKRRAKHQSLPSCRCSAK